MKTATMMCVSFPLPFCYPRNNPNAFCDPMSSFFIYNSVGSIDESALQNLSLVINLTKHIQVKARGGEDVDTEEYSNYFPSFMWVVRDFTL